MATVSSGLSDANMLAMQRRAGDWKWAVGVVEFTFWNILNLEIVATQFAENLFCLCNVSPRDSTLSAARMQRRGLMSSQKHRAQIESIITLLIMPRKLQD